MSCYPALYLRGGIIRDYETPAEKLTRSEAELKSGQDKLQSEQDELKSGQDKLQSEQDELKSGQDKLQRGNAELKSGQAKLKLEQIEQKRSRATFEKVGLPAELQTQPRRGKRETTVHSSKCRLAQQRQAFAEKKLRYFALIIVSLLHTPKTESLASLQNCKGTDCAQAPCELVEPKMKSED